MCLLLSVVCNAQSHYYWSGGKKIWLDADSTGMIVEFDNEQNLNRFASSVQSGRLPGKSLMALIRIQSKSDLAFQKINSDKSILRKMYVNKFHGYEAPFYITGDILMQPKQGISAEYILSKFKIKGMIVKKRQTGNVVVRLSDWNISIDIANAIYESGLVDWCHPDFITKTERTTTDPLFSQQYYLKNTGQNGGTFGVDIKAEQAWAITTSSNNIRVAVIDDGIEAHEDLGNRVLQGFTPLNPTSFGAPTTQNIPGVIIGHGQVCAGMIAASHNTLGIAGIAPNVHIVPINIFHTWEYNWNWGRWFSIESVQNIADAIEFAWDPVRGNADIISNSWGYDETPTNADAITQEIHNAITLGRLRNGNRLGCVVVFASGNSHPNHGISFPASVNGVLSVGAVDRNGTVWNYSCRGNRLDVVAPSGNVNLNGDVVTTDRMNALGYETGNYTSRFGGTSAACPQVAGVAALILSVRPDLTQAQVRQAVESNCTKLFGYTFSSNVNHPNGTWNSEVGYGLVNAYAAVYSVAPRIEGPSEVCSSSSVAFSAINTYASFTWSCSSNLTKTSSSGNTAIFLAGANGAGWVSIRMGNIEVARKNVQVGKLPEISGPSVIPGNGSASYYPDICGNVNSSCYWTFQQDNSITAQTAVTPNSGYPVVVMSTSGIGVTSKCSGVLTLTINGVSCTKRISATNSSSLFLSGLSIPPVDPPLVLTLYPNPASSTLHFEVNAMQTQAQNSASQQTAKSTKSAKCEVQFFNTQTGGLAFKQTVPSFDANFDIDLSSVPDGIYVLRLVRDGEIVQTQNIIVQH
jgi:subtilisin family serine protease